MSWSWLLEKSLNQLSLSFRISRKILLSTVVRVGLIVHILNSLPPLLMGCYEMLEPSQEERTWQPSCHQSRQRIRGRLPPVCHANRDAQSPKAEVGRQGLKPPQFPSSLVDALKTL